MDANIIFNRVVFRRLWVLLLADFRELLSRRSTAFLAHSEVSIGLFASIYGETPAV
jgi:hypothetical protein